MLCDCVSKRLMLQNVLKCGSCKMDKITSFRCKILFSNKYFGFQWSCQLWSCGHICTDLDIPKTGKVGEEEKLKSMLKCGRSYFF